MSNRRLDNAVTLLVCTSRRPAEPKGRASQAHSGRHAAGGDELRSGAHHKACHHPHGICVPYLEGVVGGVVDVEEVDASGVRALRNPVSLDSLEQH